MKKEIENIIFEKIVQHLDRSISEKEEQDLQNWLNESEENKQAFEEVAEIWSKTEKVCRFLLVLSSCGDRSANCSRPSNANLFGCKTYCVVRH